MDKRTQVLGALRALRNIASEGMLTGSFSGAERACVEMYRKCIATLKTVQGFEDVESILPELKDNATFAEVGFAVEMALSVLRESERPSAPHVEVTIPKHGWGWSWARAHRRHRGPRETVLVVSGKHKEDLEEQLEREQERWQELLEKLEDELEKVEERIEEARERMEERLEEIRERFEERAEEEADKEQDEPDEESES